MAITVQIWMAVDKTRNFAGEPLEISVHYLMGSTPKKSLGQAKLFLKDRFGKDETLL